MDEAPTGARRRIVAVLGPLALVLGSLLGLALAGEIVLRSIVWAKSGPQIVDGQELETFTTLQQIVRANVHGIYHEVVHRTNSRGLRGPEYTRRVRRRARSGSESRATRSPWGPASARRTSIPSGSRSC